MAVVGASPPPPRVRDRASLRVLVMAPYPVGGAPSQRFRFEQYGSALAERGIELIVRPLLDETANARLHEPGHVTAKAAAVISGAASRLLDVRRAGAYDLVFIHREAFPLGYPLIERLLARVRKPYLFDFDDAVYLPNASAHNRLIAPLKYAAKTRRIVEGAAVVVAGNEHLARWARGYNPRIRVIPSTIDTNWYRPAARDGRSPLCIGWSGTITTLPYLHSLEPVLAELQERYGLRLRVIANGHAQMPTTTIEHVRWSARREVDDLQPLDIGVMPLSDDEWSRGKCGLKALQYMALEIATVMSPVGVNREIAADGAALLATSAAEWRDALVHLIEDPDARHDIGRRGRERVLERYSVQANVDRYEEAIREAVRWGQRRGGAPRESAMMASRSLM